MKHITDPAELELGREYWLVAKEGSDPSWEPKISKLLDDCGRKFFEFRMWAEPDNNQAMDHWDIFGPIPKQEMPDFEALRKAGSDELSSDITVDDLANHIRVVDGKHDMSAGILAEHIVDWLSGKGVTIKFGMPESQEPKYGIRDNRIYVRASGEFIPFEEPIFLFRAKDDLAVNALIGYRNLCMNDEHVKIVDKRISAFLDFADKYPNRMKVADTAIHAVL